MTTPVSNTCPRPYCHIQSNPTQRIENCTRLGCIAQRTYGLTQTYQAPVTKNNAGCVQAANHGVYAMLTNNQKTRPPRLKRCRVHRCGLSKTYGCAFLYARLSYLLGIGPVVSSPEAILYLCYTEFDTRDTTGNNYS